MFSLSDNKQNYCRNILDCDQETLFDVMRTVQIVSKHLTEHCGYEGVFTQKILPYVKKGGFVMIAVPGLKEQPQGELKQLSEPFGASLDFFSNVLSIFMRRLEILHAEAVRIVCTIFAGHTFGERIM